MKKRYIFAALLVVIAGISIYLSTFTLESIKITGCEAINEETVRNLITENEIMGNTVLTYLSFKFNLKEIEDVPFLSKLELEIGSNHQLDVTVYEKSMAGCVEYMDYYVYFDKDGIVLESSSQLIDGVPCIKGLNFDMWEMGEKLPIDDEKKFQSILSITQLIEKYGLEIQGIRFTTENEIILMHDDITIELGEGEYLAIQMMNLGSILDGLEGMSGTLYMKDFDSDKATASFSKN
jgi:cell division protein FtsQ